MDQQQLIQIQMMEQEANQLNQQLQLIEQHLKEMQKLKEGLDELEITEEKDILANIGRGIYIPAKITDKNLIVEVGKGNLVKKTIPETKKIIEEQLTRLVSAKNQVDERINSLQTEMMSMMQGMQKVHGISGQGLEEDVEE